MSPPRMVEILAELRHRADAGQLGRRLGALRPAADPGAPARRCCAAGFTDDDVDRVLWRNPVEFYGQSGRLDLSDLRRRRRPPSRATRSCAGAADAAAAPRRAAPCTCSYCTNVHPAEDLAGILGQLDTYAVPIRERLGADVLGLGLWLAAPVAAELAADPAGRAPAAPRAGRARAGGGHPQRLPVPGVPGAGGQARGLPPGLDHRASGWRTRSTWPGCWPTCCPTTPPGARSPRCRWPGATRGTPTGPTAARRRLDELAAGLAGVERGPAGRSGSASSRSPAASSRPPPRPPRCCPAWTPSRLGRLPGPGPPGLRLGGAGRRRWPGCADAGLPVVKVQVSAALARRRPGADAAALRGVRRAAVPAPDPAAGCAGAPTRTTRRGADDLDAALTRGCPALAGALPRAAARRRPSRRCSTTVPVLRAALPSCSPAADRRLRPPRRRDVHLGRAAAGARARTTDAELAAGIAAELAFARDELTALGLHRSGHGSDADEPTLVVLDVVGLTPRLLAHMPRLRAVADGGFQADARHRAARGDLLGAVHLPHRRAARRARHRRQRLVLPRPRRGAALAAAQRAGRRGEAVGRGPPGAGPATRWPTSAGGTRWAPTSTGPSPRGRSTTPTAARTRTATPTRRSCTTS